MMITPYIIALYYLGAMIVYEICQIVFTKQFTNHEKATMLMLWPFVFFYVTGLLVTYYIKSRR